jgi:hypothetical protein
MYRIEKLVKYKVVASLLKNALVFSSRLFHVLPLHHPPATSNYFCYIFPTLARAFQLVHSAILSAWKVLLAYYMFLSLVLLSLFLFSLSFRVITFQHHF